MAPLAPYAVSVALSDPQSRVQVVMTAIMKSAPVGGSGCRARWKASSPSPPV